jgi:hypothetical protein
MKRCAISNRKTSARQLYSKKQTLAQPELPDVAMSGTPQAPLNQLLPELQDDTALARSELILCRFCHAAITTRQQQLTVGASHQHRFVNPAGLQFLIGCFRAAPGCDIVGQAIEEYCWFPGYAWQLATCSDCGEHLGWFYQNGEAEQFFGLIVQKLARYQS